MKLELEGVKELINELERVSDDVAGDLAKVIKKGGKIVREEAKAKAPIDTGSLRDSIRIKTTEKDRVQVEIEIGPTKFYGRFHEFGTKKMKARPFLRPALDENAEKVQEVIAEELRKTIERKM